MSTATVQAASKPRPGVRSKQAQSVARDLMAMQVEPRRAVIRGLRQRELEFVLGECHKEFGTPYALWVDTPSGFVEDVLGETIWSRQREILDAIPHNKRVAVPAGFGVGKTWVGGRATVWFCNVHAPGSALCVTTATRFRQVRYQLWPHIRKVVARAGLPGKADTTQYKIVDANGVDTVMAYGFTAPENDEAAMQGVHCHSMDTEILTDEGFKLFPDLRGDEQILTLRPDGVSEWGPITKVWRHEFDGHLNVHDGPNARISFAVTDDHRFVASPMYYRKPSHVVCLYCGKEVGAKGRVRHENRHLNDGAEKIRAEWDAARPAEREYSITPYSELPQEFFIRRTNTWGGTSPTSITFSAPKRPYRKAEKYTFDYNDWAAFLGWFVSEGYVSGSGGGRRRVFVCQSQAANPEKCFEIRALFERMGIQVTRSGLAFAFPSDSIGEWLIEHVGTGAWNKRVPESMRNASPESMRAFLDAYRDGDGCHHTHENSARYITSSPLLADDLQEMLAKLGRARKLKVMHPAGSVGRVGDVEFTRQRATYVVTEAGRPSDSNVKKENVRREPYKGMVYCISTPHETFLARRHGTTWWSGNSAKLLLIVDEAGGLAKAIGDGTNNLLTGDARMLAIGNPAMDDPGSWFEGLCDEGWAGHTAGTRTISIPATMSPAITGELTPVCRDCVPNHDGHRIADKHMPDQDWVDRTVTAYGEDHPYVIAKIHARFPKDVGIRIIPSSWVDAAAEMPEPEGLPGYARLDRLGLDGETDPYWVKAGAWVRLGVDVAADGGDEFSIARAVGDLVQHRHASAGAINANAVSVAERVLEEIHVAERLAKALGSNRQVSVKVDTIGVGWGVVGILQRWAKPARAEAGMPASPKRHGAEIVPVNVAERPDKDDEGVAMRPYRKRDEMWLAGRALLEPDTAGTTRIRLRITAKGKAQLAVPSYTTNSGGLVVVESKTSMKKRGRNSPDQAESELLAVYQPLIRPKNRGVLN